MKKLIVLTALLLGASTPALAGGIDLRIGVDLGTVGVRIAAPHHRHGPYCGHRGYYGYYGHGPRVIERIYVPGDYYRDRHWRHHRRHEREAWRHHRRHEREAWRHHRRHERRAWREHRRHERREWREHRRHERREHRRHERREHHHGRHDGERERRHDRDRAGDHGYRHPREIREIRIHR